MSGGWAAKELTDKGLKTLILERGRDVKHIKDYPTTNLYPWEFGHIVAKCAMDVQEANPIVNRCYAFHEDAAHFFVQAIASIPMYRKSHSIGYAATR